MEYRYKVIAWLLTNRWVIGWSSGQRMCFDFKLTSSRIIFSAGDSIDYSRKFLWIIPGRKCPWTIPGNFHGGNFRGLFEEISMDYSKQEISMDYSRKIPWIYPRIWKCPGKCWQGYQTQTSSVNPGVSHTHIVTLYQIMSKKTQVMLCT